MCVCECLHIYKCTMCVPCACGDQKRTSDLGTKPEFSALARSPLNVNHCSRSTSEFCHLYTSLSSFQARSEYVPLVRRSKQKQTEDLGRLTLFFWGHPCLQKDSLPLHRLAESGLILDYLQEGKSANLNI